MHKMTKSTFIIGKNPNTGIDYISIGTDEMSKNHRAADPEKAYGGIMPAMPKNPLCPVASFRKYLSKLNPACHKLWQRTRDTFQDDEPVWYCNVGVGEKTLQKFMPELSRKCNLSTRYSNHSIRATGATILSKLKYNPSQIMAMTGHRSVQSLAVYQKVDDDEKMEMGSSLGDHLVKNTKQVIKYDAPNNHNENTIRDDLENLVLDDWNPVPSLPGNTSTTALSFPGRLFTNCQINNLTINVHK